MDFSDIAPMAGAAITIITFVSAVAMYWLDMKLKPIKKRLDDIEEQNRTLAETMAQIVDGLLTNDQIPRR